jgi:hypothetical protein
MSVARSEVVESWPIWELAKAGALKPGFTLDLEGTDSLGQSFGQYAALQDAVEFTLGGHVQRICITYTSCGKGGVRAWWACPICNARRGVLFLRSRVWGCRGCMGLPYRSQRMSRLERATAKVQRLRMLLEDTGSLVDGRPLRRPHGMRRRTFQRRRRELAQTLTLVAKLTLQAHQRFLGRDGPPLAGVDWRSRIPEGRIEPKPD